MATRYLDHGSYAAYAASPTWGVPQEGDGTATTASATASTVSVVFTANATAASSTCTICGVVFSAIAGANSGLNFQVGAGLTNTLDNLVTQINACTTAVGAGVATNGTPQLRNLVFARKTGTDTLEVMSRHGSTQCNGATNTNWKATAANWTSSTTLPANFAGGVGGCWGYLFNHLATIWPQAVAIGGYGLWAAALPYMGTLAADDVVKVRSNKTLTLATNSTVTINPAAMGSLSSPVRFDIDNGTEWPADGSTPVLTVNTTASVGGGYGFGFGSTLSQSAFMHIKGVEYAGGQKNLVFSCSSSGLQTNFAYQSVSISMPVRFENIHWLASGTPATTSSYVAVGGANVSSNAYQSASFLKCKFTWPGQSTVLIGMGSGGYNYRAEFHGCEFVATGMVTATTSVITLFNNNTHRLLMDSCVFTGFVPDSRLFAASSTTTGNNTAILRNCALGNANLLGPNTLTSAIGEMEAGERGVFITSQYGYNEFVYERSGRVYAEWNYSKSRPTLSAVLSDGVTPWCIYAVPTTVAAQIGKHAPVEIPIICKLIPANGDLTQGVRTLTLNFLLEATVTWTKRDMSVVVTYSNTDGTVAVVDTYDPNAAALDTSTAAWTSTSWRNQDWEKKKFEITTPTAVLSSSQVGIVVRFHTAAGADTKGVIIDPEVVVA